MRKSHRQHLRQNEVALAVTWLRQRLSGHRGLLAWTLVGVVAAAVALGGYFTWRQYAEGRASGLLGEALVVASTPVVTPAQRLTDPPPPGMQTFSSNEERAEAAVPKLLEAADAYPSTPSGIAARYYAAAALVETGALDEARAQYDQVVARDVRGLWGRMARLGLATVDLEAGRHDAAIAALRDLADQADSDLPADGLLMQLGQAYQRAGQPDLALETYNRVVDEFPASLYADEARSRAAALETPAAS